MVSPDSEPGRSPHPHIGARHEPTVIMPRRRRGRIDLAGLTLAAAIVLATAILAAHAALLPEAHWQADDFICAAFARDFGLRYLWRARIEGWSPRPFSELALYVFNRLAAARQAPFTVPFLGLLWATLLASTLVTSRRGPAVAQRILIGLATACMFLLGHPVAEMFFWPAGAVAYLTTLAAGSLALFLLVDGRAASRSGAVALSASLTICAASSEAGTLAAVPLTFAVAAGLLHRRRVLLLAPLVVAGFVFWTLAHNRLAPAGAAARLAPLQHVVQSVRGIPRTLLDDIRPLWPARLLFALGLRWCWTLAARGARPPATLAWFAVALVAAASATIAASYFHTGTLCCERHDTLRQDWLILALVGLAIWSTRWPAGPRIARLGPAVLLVACLLGVAPRVGAIVGDFRLMRTIVAVNRANWRSGRDASTPAMVFQLPPPAAIAGPVIIPPGQYAEPATAAWFAHGIMDFFGKRSLTIRPAAASPPR